VPAPLAGTVVAVKVKPGQVIASGELIMLLEAMKMETEVRSPEAGTVLAVSVKEGDSLQVGQTLLTLG
jgi:oxaloacetate decarboxylase alpha subunit